jgi:hypothetical protein
VGGELVTCFSLIESMFFKDPGCKNTTAVYDKVPMRNFNIEHISISLPVKA